MLAKFDEDLTEDNKVRGWGGGGGGGGGGAGGA